MSRLWQLLAILLLILSSQKTLHWSLFSQNKVVPSILHFNRTLLSRGAQIYTRSRRFFYSVARRPHGNIAEIFALCTTERNNLLFIHMVNNPIVFTILPKALRSIRILLKAPTTPGVARFSTPWIGSLKQAVTTADSIFFQIFQSIWKIDLENRFGEGNKLVETT